ncbi:MAG: beta-CASP ribonuclease aCPSF1 [Candidatus Micrarchaeota archaeon]
MNTPKEIEEALSTALPSECELAKVELEGPQIVIYLKNIAAFYRDENLVTKIASRLRKKVVLRCDSSMLMAPDKALEQVKQLIPVEAGVKDIRFDPNFNEVYIEANKPGVVIGKGGSVLKSIILATGWSPKVLRAPTMPSETETAIRNALFNASDVRKKFLAGLGKKITSANGGPAGCEWVKLTALGGFREVGRSCLLLQTPRSNVLLDCGINADTSDPSRAYPYLNAMGLALEQLDAVILSHAHLDHSGFIPYLYAYGYEGPVYCTPPSRDLMVLLQQDCVNVMHSEHGKSPYGERDIKKELNHVITREYGEVTDVTPDVRFTFHDAGHMLGSASIHLHIGEGFHNVVYSGDIKYGKTNLCNPAATNFPRVDTLILESTYGSHLDVKPRLDECEARVRDVISRTIANRGKVLIPVIASGRAQEIMITLEQQFKDPDFPVYFDGLSKESSAIHTVYPEYLKRNLQRRILQNDSPFDKPMFKTITTQDQRKAIAEGDEPAVILAPSGMLSGGPSVDFLRRMAGDSKNTLIFVGWQAAMSLGRKIQNGEREVPMLNSANKQDALKVNMNVVTVDGFSGHSDWSQLLAYARNIRPKPGRIFTNHGEESKCEELSRTLNRMLHTETRVVMDLDSVRLK